MTVTTDPNSELSESDAPGRGGLSSLQKALIGVVVFFFATIPVFWYLEVHVGVSHGVASNTMVLLHVVAFATALALPWLPLPGQRGRTRSES